MLIYNSLSRKVEEFVPRDPNQVTMYTCGPTVYHFAHIGNLRSYIMEDILERTLKYIGYNVKRAMNITDVGHLSGDSDEGEDKMLIGAAREHKTVLEIAKFYTEAFKSDCEKLNVVWPQIVVPATTCIDQYIKMIKDLIKKGYAYESCGNVYFDTSKLKEYYVLTNHNQDDLIVGARENVEADEGKKNQADFALWFTKSKFADQELKWQSPWGNGYPGWHIECSGISTKYLGEYLDIHCGGVDNKFPHHTNEIAQSEGYLGHKWCSYWFHVEHLNNESGKMSKSSGGFVTIEDLIKKGYNPLVYRLFCLQSHYQNQLIFSYERLDGAAATYSKLKEKIAILQKDTESKSIDQAKVDFYDVQFKAALENNLNTSLALTVLFDAIKDDCSSATKLKIASNFDKVLGLDLLKQEKTNVPEEIKQLAEKRWAAKKAKNWAEADLLRAELTAKGYMIKDSAEGYEITKM